MTKLPRFNGHSAVTPLGPGACFFPDQTPIGHTGNALLHTDIVTVSAAQDGGTAPARPVAFAQFYPATLSIPKRLTTDAFAVSAGCALRMQTSPSYSSSMASCQHQHSHAGKLSSIPTCACSLQLSHRRSVKPLKQCRAQRSRPSVSRSSPLHISELGCIYLSCPCCRASLYFATML